MSELRYKAVPAPACLTPSQIYLDRELGFPLIINLCLANYLDFYLFKGNPLLLGIRLFFGPVPAIILILSLPLLIWYPITRATHAKLLADIKAKQSAAAE